MDLRQILFDFRRRIAQFADSIASSVEPQELLALDEACTKISGVQNLLSEVENGTKKHPAKCLRVELLAAADECHNFALAFLVSVGADVAAFNRAYAEAVAGIQLPTLDVTAAESVERQEEELARSIATISTLLDSAETKAVAKAARNVATQARRIIKTNLISGAYVDRQRYTAFFVNAIVRSAFTELRKFDDAEFGERFHREVSGRLNEFEAPIFDSNTLREKQHGTRATR